MPPLKTNSQKLKADRQQTVKTDGKDKETNRNMLKTGWQMNTKARQTVNTDRKTDRKAVKTDRKDKWILVA